MEYNTQPRAVKCLLCKTQIMTDVPNPQCPHCHCNMITIVPSMFEDEKNAEEVPLVE